MSRPRLGAGLPGHRPVPGADWRHDNDPDIVCTVHVDRVDDDPDSLADLEAQALEAIHG
ncbi:hypothetical protein [Streptomyces yanii]|uniref:Uncharacterized protein n=1 Tax=Streptomyces yanii TaxID=78510 RepID=A0ABV5RMN5_9ACTN